jgi:hypothetical protein
VRVFCLFLCIASALRGRLWAFLTGSVERQPSDNQENKRVSLTDSALYICFDFVNGVPDDDLSGMEDGPHRFIYLIMQCRQFHRSRDSRAERGCGCLLLESGTMRGFSLVSLQAVIEHMPS